MEMNSANVEAVVKHEKFSDHHIQHAGKESSRSSSGTESSRK